MNRSLFLTLSLLFVLGVPAQAQKRRTQASRKPAAETQSAPSYQDGQIVAITICKGLPIPEGYVTSGEAADDSCPHGAWLLKKKGSHSYTPTTPAQSGGAAAESDEEDGDAPKPRRKTTAEIVEERADETNRKARIDNATYDHKVMVGMTKEQVLKSWGRPEGISRHTDSESGYSETWTYTYRGGTAYIYFKDGKVSSYSASY